MDNGDAKFRMKKKAGLLLLVSVVCVELTVLAVAQDEPVDGDMIPEAEIASLQEQLKSLLNVESTIEARRACKKIVRGAEALIEAHSKSPDRFRLLGVIFETEKIMFTMRQSDEYREALLETAKKLVEAPDEDALVRVEPDMMLLQRQFAKERCSPEEQALEIARFADRYRRTPAEAQSLMMAATSAFDLGNRELLEAFRDTLEKSFSEDPKVAAFMRERFASGNVLNFSGEFIRADGKRVAFPLGETYLVCFWSLDTPLLKERVEEIRAMQNRYKGQFNVFSFNLDELGDCGQGALQKMKLDWIPLRLPGGVDSPTYLSVGRVSQMYTALVVGPHGLVTMGKIGRGTSPLYKIFEAVERSPRRTSLFRSLCIGDFLVADMNIPGKASIPGDKLKAIQACFPAIPERYRLTEEQEFKNYETAEKLCGDVAAGNTKNPGLWVIHNFRIIALMGMWRMTGDMEYLDTAERLARTSIKMKLPREAVVIPQFCLTTKALMARDANPGELLGRFVEASGGESAPPPGSAYAAALMLALEVHARDEYIKYRNALLGEHAQDPSARPVSAFLLEKTCAAELFEKALTGGVVAAGDSPAKAFKLDWKAATGNKLKLTGASNDVINSVVFVDPVGDRNAEAISKRVGDHLVSVARARPRNDLKVTFVFKCADTNKVAGLMKKNRWSFDSVCLTEGEWQKCAIELGLFSADRRPNVYLVRSDGSIMMALSGVSLETENPDRLNARIDNVLRDHDLKLAEKALLRKDYDEYAARLKVSFPPESRDRRRAADNVKKRLAHRRKIVWAYMQAGDWQKALEAINTNIEVERGKPDPRRPTKWCPVCHGYLHDTCLRIHLLRMMGAKKEADEALAMIDIPKCSHGKSEATLWEWVEATRVARISNPRFAYLKDPKRYLEYLERGMRSGRQNLFGFGITQDVMTRSRIYEKLGNAAAARLDRRDAVVRAWPYKVREYDLSILHESAVRRRRQAQAYLDAGEWKKALDLSNININQHEAEPLRCESMCKICGGQVQSFKFRIGTLRGLGRKDEAEMNAEMCEAITCPPGKQLEQSKWFPVNRMYGGGSGINRLNFIDGVMKGQNCYANRQDREYRLEFANDLLIRADAREKLGDKSGAERDRKRAEGLTFPLGPGAARGEDGSPSLYADIVFVADE